MWKPQRPTPKPSSRTIGYTVAWWAAIRDHCNKPLGFILKKSEEAGITIPTYLVYPIINC